MIGIHHAGIVVSDLDQSIDFYTTVLGLQLLIAPTEPAEGPDIDAALEVPGARLRGAFLRVGTGSLELLEFQAPPAPSPMVMPAHALGAQHVAFEVDDIVAERAAMQARGARFVNDIAVIDDGPLAGLRTTFLLDPDDVRIELVEVAYQRLAQREIAVARYSADRSGAARYSADRSGATG
jgi:catechol 2,3-dioxygenase-like lactoylglutathione lyase family enzyme